MGQNVYREYSRVVWAEQAIKDYANAIVEVMEKRHEDKIFPSYFDWDDVKYEASCVAESGYPKYLIYQGEMTLINWDYNADRKYFAKAYVKALISLYEKGFRRQ